MTTQATPAASWRKLALQAGAGAVAGGGGMLVAMELIAGQSGVHWQASQIVLAGVGFIYFLMGAFVGVGILAPRLLGQRMLNFADAEEIVEERRSMAGSSLTCVAVGAALFLLAYATVDGAAGPVTAAAAFWILVALLVAGTAVSILMWRSLDELWRQLTLDASAIAGNILIAMCVVWGGGAAAGLVAGPHPLDLISATFGVFLLASFVAAGRRGMMGPP